MNVNLANPSKVYAKGFTKRFSSWYDTVLGRRALQGRRAHKGEMRCLPMRMHSGRRKEVNRYDKQQPHQSCPCFYGRHAADDRNGLLRAGDALRDDAAYSRSLSRTQEFRI